MGRLNGRMAKSILVGGWKESRMAKAFLLILMELRGKAFGKMERELGGIIELYLLLLFLIIY